MAAFHPPQWGCERARQSYLSTFIPPPPLPAWERKKASIMCIQVEQQAAFHAFLWGWGGGGSWVQHLCASPHHCLLEEKKKALVICIHIRQQVDFYTVQRHCEQRVEQNRISVQLHFMLRIHNTRAVTGSHVCVSVCQSINCSAFR